VTRTDEPAAEAGSTGTASPEADAGRLAAMVAGLNAIVWERDPGTLAVRWVNDRIAEVLGHPVVEWLADPVLWQRVLHPADREAALAAVRRAVAEVRDFTLDYRVLAADGRQVWLHHMGHVQVDAAGRPAALHAVLVDVTEQRRREQAARLSAAVGAALVAPGPLTGRLQAVVELLAGEICDQATVWLRDDDGRSTAVAAAPPGLADRLLALDPVVTPPELLPAFERGAPLLLRPVTEEMLRAATDDEQHYAAVAAAMSPGALLVAPLLTGDGRVLGSLTMGLLEGGRQHDDDDLSLAADLGRRVAATVRAERAAERQHRLHELSLALSAAGTVADAAAELAVGLRQVLGAEMVTVCTIAEDGLLHPVHTLGYPADRLERYSAMRLSAPFPLTVAVRIRTPQWLPDRSAWERDYPEVMPDVMEVTQAAAALPLLVGDRAIGGVGITFRSPRRFDADTRAFLLTLASQVAVAIERAALADVRGEIAETLQRSLLPRGVPPMARLGVATRYVPGVRGTRAGGDWYDVLPFDDGRVALVVGDVVGEGAAAAAVMGQLRSALATLLLEGHEPARALELLDRFARTVEGAAVSTVTCLLLDPASGSLLQASAGHPPALVLDDSGARFLAGGEGPALALPGRALRRQAGTTLATGATLVLYTDGLVERRGSTLDDGMRRLAETAWAARSGAVPALLDTLLDRLVGDARSDDVAVVAARPAPAPLALDLLADASRLGGVRAELRRWAAQAALDGDTTDDLLLAVGETAANAVEHAYGGAPGRLRVSAAMVGGERVVVSVADEGTWRPPPVDPGFRGRGLQLLRRLAREVDVDAGCGGTVVRFAVPLPRSGGAVTGRAEGEADERPAAMQLSGDDELRCVQLSGDLDLAGVVALRTGLLEQMTVAGPVVLDLTGLTSLSSSGLGLLLEASRQRGPGRREVLLPREGPVRRLLDVTGLADALQQ
jgi:anti-anti-sigma factor